MDERAAVYLTASFPILFAVASLLTVGSILRRFVAVVLAIGVVLGSVAVIYLPTVRRGTDTYETLLGQWSPLGLYGVTVAVRTDAIAGLLLTPCFFVAAFGWVVQNGAPWSSASRRVSSAPRSLVESAMFLALAAVAWALIGGDLVTVTQGVGAFFTATSAALWFSGARTAALRRIAVSGFFSLCLLTCVLLLGKVNGTFIFSQLASVSFSDASLAGLVVVAIGAGSIVPFHGWTLRLASHSLMPAVMLGGGALTLSLIDLAFVTTRGDIASVWSVALTLLGILGVVGSLFVAWTARHDRVGIAVILSAQSSLALFALASGAPATISSLCLLHVISSTACAVLWVLALSSAHVGRRGLRGNPGSGARQPDVGMRSPFYRGWSVQTAAARSSDIWSKPIPWAVVLIVATASGLPGTIGGLAADTYLNALASSSETGWMLRVAVLVLDTTLLSVGGSVLAWIIASQTTAHSAGGHTLGRPMGEILAVNTFRSAGESPSGRLASAAFPWLLLATAMAVVIAPAVLPATFVGPWFAPVSILLAGTSTPPRLLDVFRIANPDRVALGVVAAFALFRSQRGQEMLPPTARALIGVLVLVVAPLVRFVANRFRVASSLATHVSREFVQLSERGAIIFRLVEERYYAAVAMLLMVILLYSIGR